MAKYEFTATHGVSFGEMADGAYQVWAAFERDRDQDTPEGEKRYSFATDDAKVAERLRAADGYGITEAKAPARRGAAAKSS